MLSGGRRVMSDRYKRVPNGSSSGAQKSSLPAICKGATILIVDDNPSVLSALARLIRAAGFQVKAFDRPSALLASEVPKTKACMIVDVHLPEMNGIELCKALAASGRGLAAILITGRNDAETQRLIEKAHPVAALFKPVDERALLEAVTQALALSNGDRGDD
jgi:FixJ family two-component response regulator